MFNNTTVDTHNIKNQIERLKCMIELFSEGDDLTKGEQFNVDFKQTVDSIDYLWRDIVTSKQVRTDSSWQKSEDSFLKLCCEISSKKWGKLYYWPANMNWPKLNFLRILDEDLTVDEFDELVASHRPFFEVKNIDFNLKIPSTVQISSEILKRLEHKGVPIVFLKTAYREKRDVPKQLQLKKVETLDELESWWCIFSTYPTKREKLASPFYKVVQRAFHNDTEFYLGLWQNKPISCFAIDIFDDGCKNLWGVSTDQDFKRRGIYKDLQWLYLSHSEEEIYLQVNLDSPLYRYYIDRPETKKLMEEKRYVLR